MPLTNSWDLGTYGTSVQIFFRNPKVSQAPVNDAKKAQQEKGSVPALVGGIINSLPNGKPVSGAEISKEINAAAESASGLSKQAQDIVSNISSVIRRGSTVTIHNKGSLSKSGLTTIGTVHIAKTGSFSYQLARGELSFHSVRGVGVSLGFLHIVRVEGLELGQTGYSVTARVAWVIKRTITEPY